MSSISNYGLLVFLYQPTDLNISLLLQMVTGYHEKNEVVCKNEPSTSLSANFSLGMSDGVQVRPTECMNGQNRVHNLGIFVPVS